MSEENPVCPKCSSTYCYCEGSLWICPECFHEWTPPTENDDTRDKPKFIDINGAVLQNGDTVIIAKDLKVGSSTIKSGTKVKNIRLLDEPEDGHDISCKVDGFGSIYLKCVPGAKPAFERIAISFSYTEAGRRRASQRR